MSSILVEGGAVRIFIVVDSHPISYADVHLNLLYSPSDHVPFMIGVVEAHGLFAKLLKSFLRGSSKQTIPCGRSMIAMQSTGEFLQL
jgi:hypothetical protein